MRAFQVTLRAPARLFAGTFGSARSSPDSSDPQTSPLLLRKRTPRNMHIVAYPGARVCARDAGKDASVALSAGTRLRCSPLYALRPRTTRLKPGHRSNSTAVAIARVN